MILNKFSKKEGVVVISSFWILLILAFLALSIAYRASIGIKLTQYYNDKIQARSITELAIKEFIEVLKNGENIYNNPDLFKNVEVENAVYSIIAEDEQARLNINNVFITEDILTNLPFIASDFANDIIAYPKFKSIEELTVLDSFDAENFSKALEFITVYGSGRININSAKKEVLLAFGIKEPLTEDEKGLLLMGNNRNIFTNESDCFRLNIVVKVGKVNTKTIVVLEEEKILYWYES